MVDNLLRGSGGRLKVIANPSSRSGRGKKLWQDWMVGLRDRGFEVEWCESESAEHAEDLAREADLQDVVVVSGGDGTINRAISGVLNSGTVKTVGILYSGTSPDFCKFHNIPYCHQGALECLMAARSRDVDVCKMTCIDEIGRKRVLYFACSSNIGLGSNTARFANRWRRFLGDFLGTALGLVRAILVSRAFSAAVEVDGSRHSFENVRHIFVVKNPHIASGMRLNLDIAPDDGRVCVVVVHGLSGLQILRKIKNIYDGTVVQEEGVFVKSGRSISLDMDMPQEVEMDGDHCTSSSKIDVEVEIGCIKLISNS